MSVCSARVSPFRSRPHLHIARLASLTLGLLLLSAASAAAQGTRGGLPLSSYDALRSACEGARDVGRRELYQVSVTTGDWRFAAYDEEREVLPVDARPSLRVLAGVAAFLPSGLERIEFPVSAAELATLRERASRATLRVGFFLGFDGAGERACLVRGAATQNLVRGDLADLERVDAEGNVVTRAEYDRLRAWLDDPERVVVVGEGPRAAIGEPVVHSAGVTADAAWVTRARTQLPQLVQRCYVPALAREASRRATVTVRLTVNAATGAVQSADVELSTLGDTEGARCVAEELGRSVSIPALRGGGASVQVRVPVTLISE